MSATEEPVPVDPPAATESSAAPVEAEAEAEAAAPSADEEPKSKPASSSAKKATTSKPAKGRPSAAGASKKGGASAVDEHRKYEIADPETLPRNVTKQRPGKNPNTYCCQFFPAADITAYTSEPHRKAAGGLMEAYQTAQDPTEWDSQQTEIHKKRDEADAEAEEGVDELEDEDEPASGGKRKRSAAEKKDKKKKAKTAAKSKAAVESEDEAPKSKAKATPKGKADKSKGAKAPVSKAEKEEPADDDPLASNPECIKVKDWRHKLQRAFLGKTLPTAEEMPQYDDIFRTIEGHENMSIEALQYSKIGKVMKKILVLTAIPRNDDFKITDRASKLMHQWQKVIDSSADKPNGETAAAAGLNGDGDAEAKKPLSAAEDKAAPAETEDKKVDETPAEKTDGEKMEVDA